MKQSLHLNFFFFFVPFSSFSLGPIALTTVHLHLSNPSSLASQNYFLLFPSSSLSLPFSLLITLLWSCALSVPISLSLAKGSVQQLNAIRQRSRVVLINR